MFMCLYVNGRIGDEISIGERLWCEGNMRMKWVIKWDFKLMGGCCRGCNWARTATGAVFDALHELSGGEVNTLLIYIYIYILICCHLLRVILAATAPS